MESDLGELAQAAANLAAVSAGRADLGSRADQLGERLALCQFRVAVVGE
jgi:hypothetical protein